MQIFIKHFLEQRPSQYWGVFVRKLISEADTPHANMTPTRTPAHTSRCRKTRGVGTPIYKPYSYVRPQMACYYYYYYYIFYVFFYAVSVINSRYRFWPVWSSLEFEAGHFWSSAITINKSPSQCIWTKNWVLLKGIFSCLRDRSYKLGRENNRFFSL